MIVVGPFPPASGQAVRDQRVAVVPKNQTEEIRVSLNQHKWWRLACVMVWEARHGVMAPTSRGFNLQIAKIPALIEALRQALVEASVKWPTAQLDVIAISEIVATTNDDVDATNGESLSHKTPKRRKGINNTPYYPPSSHTDGNVGTAGLGKANATPRRANRLKPIKSTKDAR